MQLVPWQDSMLKPTEFTGRGHEYGERQQQQYRILDNVANDPAGSTFRGFRCVGRLFCHEEISLYCFYPKNLSIESPLPVLKLSFFPYTKIDPKRRQTPTQE